MYQVAHDFWKSKTTHLAGAAILTAIAGFLNGTLDPNQTFQAIFLALASLTVRDTIQKGNQENALTTDYGNAELASLLRSVDATLAERKEEREERKVVKLKVLKKKDPDAQDA